MCGIEHKVSLLGTLHRLRGLLAPSEADGRIRPMMRNVAKAVRAAASPALPRAKKAVTLAPSGTRPRRIRKMKGQFGFNYIGSR